MDCERLGERLSALIDGELEDGERAALEAHLDACPACEAEFDLLDRTAGLVGTIDEPRPSSDFMALLDARLRREMYADGLVVIGEDFGAFDDGDDGGASGRDPADGGASRAGRIVSLAWAATWRAAAAMLLVWGGFQLHDLATRSSSGPVRGVARPLASDGWIPPEALPDDRPEPRGEDPRRGAGASGGSGVPGDASSSPDPRGSEASPDDTGSGSNGDAGRPPRGSDADAGTGTDAGAGGSSGGAQAPPREAAPGAAEPDGGASSPPSQQTPPHDAPGSSTFAQGRPGTAPREGGSATPDGRGAPSPAERAERERRLVRAFRGRAADDRERATILYELAASGGSDATTLLREVLVRRPARYGDLGVEAIAALGSYPYREGIWVLIEVARDRPIEVRHALLSVEDEALLTWMAERLLPGLDEARYPDARLLVIDALAAHPREGTGAALARALEQTHDVQAQTRIVEALGRVGGEPALVALSAALGDRRSEVRAAAAAALGQAPALAPEERYAALLRACASSDASPVVRGAAAAALGRFSDTDTVDTLLALRSADPRGQVRSQAQIALMRISGEGLYDHEAWTAWRRGPAAGALASRTPGAPLAALLPAAAPEGYHGIPVISDGVCFLVDVSGSMRHDGKLERAERELRKTLAALPAGTPFTVGVFADGAELCFRDGLERASERTVEEALAFVQGAMRRAGGGRTDLGRALLRAVRLPGVDQVFLLSDGAPTTGLDADALLDSVRRWTWDYRVRVHAIGLYRGQGALRVDGPTAPAAEPVRFIRELTRMTGGVFVRND